MKAEKKRERNKKRGEMEERASTMLQVVQTHLTQSWMSVCVCEGDVRSLLRWCVCVSPRRVSGPLSHKHQRGAGRCRANGCLGQEAVGCCC